MTYAERIESKIKAAFAPTAFTLVDDSHRHASHSDRIAALKTPDGESGHAPIDGQGETHFALTIVSAVFEGQSRVARQRMVYDALQDELRERVHALALKTLTPDEATGKDS
jgi:BolA protein